MVRHGVSAGSLVTGVFVTWVMAAKGGGKVRVTDGNTANYAQNCSPSGRVLFTSNRLGHESIWSLQPGTRVAPPNVTTVTAGAITSESTPTALVRDDN